MRPLSFRGVLVLTEAPAATCLLRLLLLLGWAAWESAGFVKCISGMVSKSRRGLCWRGHRCIESPGGQEVCVHRACAHMRRSHQQQIPPHLRGPANAPRMARLPA